MPEFESFGIEEEGQERSRGMPWYVELPAVYGAYKYGPKALESGAKFLEPLAQAHKLNYLSKALGYVGKRGIPGLVASALIGGAIGTANEALKGGDLKESFEEGFKEAVAWPLYDVGFKALGAGFKLAKEKGLMQGLKGIPGGTWESLYPDRRWIGEFPLPEAMRKKFGQTKLEDVIRSAPQMLRSRGLEEGNQLFFLKASEDEFSHALGQLGQKIKTGEITPTQVGNMKAVFPSLEAYAKEGTYTVPKHMTEEEFYETLELLKPITDVMRGRSTVRGLGAGLTREVNKQFLGKVTKLVSGDMEVFGNDAANIVFKDIYKKALDSGVAPKEVLSHIMEDSTSPELIKRYARDIYDMAEQTIPKISQAYRDSTMKGWVSNIARSPKSTLAIMPEKMNLMGMKTPDKEKWVDVSAVGKELGDSPFARHFRKEFEGAYVDRDVYNGVFGVAHSGDYAKGVLGTLNRYVIQPWKLTRAVARPTAFMRNVIGNFILNDWSGKFPLSPWTPEGIKHYIETYKMWRAKGPELLEFAKYGGKSSTTFFSGELNYMRNLNPEDKLPPKILQSFYSSSPIKGATEAFGNVENFAKFAKFTWNRKNGMSVKDAVIDAVGSTFHYGEVPHTVRAARETLVPFATFSSKMMDFLPEAMVNHPWRVAKYVAVPWMITQMALKNLNISGSEWDDMKAKFPDWMKSGSFMLMPFRDKEGRLQLFDLTWWLPGLNDAAMSFGGMMDARRWVQNPLLTVWKDVISNKKGITDQPIYQDFETPGDKTGRVLNYMYQQLFPTWMPAYGALIPGMQDTTINPKFVGAEGGIDWKGIVQLRRQEQGAPTTGQIIATQLGFKTQAIEEGLLAEKKMKEFEYLKRGLKGKMNSELKKYPLLKDEIVERYTRLMQNLERNVMSKEL